MRKLFSVLTAAALCAALLAGCGGSDHDTASAGQGGAATAAPGTVDDDTMMGEPSPTPGSGSTDTGAAGNGGMATGENAGNDVSGTAYSAEGLSEVLGGILTVEGGTAGGSLQTAQAAAALVEFASTCGADSATLGADTEAWLRGLNEAERAMLKENWAAVRDRARSISEDLDSNQGILADAGITTDLSALDMSGTAAFLNTVDSILGI